MKISLAKPAGKEIRRRVRFHLAAEPGNQVFVAGTFNGWNTSKHPLAPIPNNGAYGATLFLPTGRHEYKFVVNGQWQVDPQCPATVPNAYGSLNSVIQV